MQKALRAVVADAVGGKTWQKFTCPTAGRGNTVFPKKAADQERLGVRFDYDGEITSPNDGLVYHKFKMQPNAGSVPSTIKNWREANGGTHGVMADVLVKKDGTKEDVKAGLQAATATVQGV